MGGSSTSPRTRRLGLAMALAALATGLTLLSAGSPALAKGHHGGKGPKPPANQHKHSHSINYSTGRIGPIEIGMYRGTVSKALGAPESVAQVPNSTGYKTHGKLASLYLATYEDGGLAAVYSDEGKKKRFHIVRAVQTTSPIFTGAISVGKTYFPAADCLTPDGQAGMGPDEGPETADYCLIQQNPFAYAVMDNQGSRASEPILKIVIAQPGLGMGLYKSLFEEEMENSQCFEPECSVHTN